MKPSIFEFNHFVRGQCRPLSCYPAVGGSDLIINCTRLHNDNAVAFCVLLELHLAETIRVHELLNSKPCVNIVQIRNIESVLIGGVSMRTYKYIHLKCIIYSNYRKCGNGNIRQCQCGRVGDSVIDVKPTDHKPKIRGIISCFYSGGQSCSRVTSNYSPSMDPVTCL